MNVLIIDNEIYLAQKVASRIFNDGHHCDLIEEASLDKIIKEYDVILLSTSFASPLRNNIIKKYSCNSIVILLASYISDETVTNHIKDGAKDYIMKPFVIDELLRKIYNYIELKNIKKELLAYKSYFDFTMHDIDIESIKKNFSFPVLIETDYQKYADKIVFKLFQQFSFPIKFVCLESNNWQEQIISSESNLLFYCINYHTLKPPMRSILLKLIKGRKFVISSLEKDNEFPYEKLTINNNQKILLNSSILTINEYVKNVITHNQNKYSDTELSKKLGISRKSLWEKRKKLDIEKITNKKG